MNRNLSYLKPSKKQKQRKIIGIDTNTENNGFNEQIECVDQNVIIRERRNLDEIIEYLEQRMQRKYISNISENRIIQIKLIGLFDNKYDSQECFATIEITDDKIKTEVLSISTHSFSFM